MIWMSETCENAKDTKKAENEFPAHCNIDNFNNIEIFPLGEFAIKSLDGRCFAQMWENITQDNCFFLATSAIPFFIARTCEKCQKIFLQSCHSLSNMHLDWEKVIFDFSFLSFKTNPFSHQIVNFQLVVNCPYFWELSSNLLSKAFDSFVLLGNEYKYRYFLSDNKLNICKLDDLIFSCRNTERYLEDYNFMCFGCFEILCQKYCRPGPSSGPLLLILSEKFNNQTSLPLSMEKEGESKSHRRTKHRLVFFQNLSNEAVSSLHLCSV